MPHVIGLSCVDVMDSACVEVCPVDCIHCEEGVDRKLYVDPEECIECGACVAACAVGACFSDDDLPEDQLVFAEIDALWYSDREAARARIDQIKPV